jgi:two-component system sensor histidine kinase UhpB
VRSTTSLPLYWRVVLTNGVVFFVGTLALALSPATVSTRVLQSEAVVLAVGLTVILLTNALLLRRSLAPLDRLASKMATIDSPAPAQRLPQEGQGVVADLIASFNAMLRRLESERRSSNAKAIAAQESERQRIAQELHDEIGQTLTVVLLGLKRVVDQAPPELAEELRSIQEATRESMEEVRRVAHRLRPGVLEDLGLMSALSALATDVANHSDVHVQRGFAPGLPTLDDQAELVVYRVAQEALTNVSRHAQARTVELFLSRQGQALLLRVADDGRGIHGAPEGSGILGMRERAELIGGELAIRPSDKGGTEVLLLVPIRTAP